MISPRTIAVVSCLLLLVAGALMGPHLAHARDMTGKAGVGVQLTGEGMPMAVVRYWRTHVVTEFMAGWVARKRSFAPVSVKNGQALPPTSGAAAPTAESIQSCIAAAVAAEVNNDATTQCSATLDLAHLRVAGGLMFRLHDAPRASLTLGVRPWLQVSSQTLTETTSVQYANGTSSPASARPTITSLPLQWGVEIPIVAEAFLTDHASVIGQFAVGLGYGRHPEEAQDLSATHVGPRDWWVSSTGTYSGGAGFVYYF